VLFGVGYVRDSLGRITQLFDTTQGTPTRWSYVYDGVGRLIADSVNGALFHAFTYDSNGNRLSYTSGAGTVTYVYDDQDRLTSSTGPGGTSSYSYTSNGELTRKIAGSDTTRYTYDVLGNLIKVILPNHDSIEYLIDGQNRRVGRKFNGAVTQRWLYQNQLNPVAELDSAGNVVSRFVYGSRLNVPDYMLKGGSVYRLITDHPGSVRLVVDTATGTVAQWAKYDEWGVVTADSGAGFQPFGYAGGMVDVSSELVRFGFRDLDTRHGLWTATDPIGFAGGSLGLYQYAYGDPINHYDPSGLQSSGFDRMGRIALALWQLLSNFGRIPDGMPPTVPTITQPAPPGTPIPGGMGAPNLSPKPWPVNNSIPGQTFPIPGEGTDLVPPSPPRIPGWVSTGLRGFILSIPLFMKSDYQAPESPIPHLRNARNIRTGSQCFTVNGQRICVPDACEL
jgi:RHS repeat-associated protein